MTELSVATWNLWWRFGPWRDRAPLIARELARIGADVVGLQEVHARVDGRPDPEPGEVHLDIGADPADAQVAWLAARTGHTWSAMAWRRNEDGFAFGNGMLATSAPVEVHVAPLPSLEGQYEEHRTVLAARFVHDGQPVLVATTHLNFRWDQSAVRQAQVDELLAVLARLREPDEPVVLTGDLNARPDSAEVARLTGRTAVPTPGLAFVDAWEAAGGHAGATWSRSNDHVAVQSEPERRIDYVLVSFPDRRGRGLVLDARRFGTVRTDGLHPSDHFGVVATIDPAPRDG